MMRYVLAVMGLVAALITIVAFLPVYNALAPFITGSLTHTVGLGFMISIMIVLLVVAMIVRFMMEATGFSGQENYEYRR